MNTHKTGPHPYSRAAGTSSSRDISLPLSSLGWWVSAVITAGWLTTSLQVEARERDSLVGPYPYDFPARASVQGSLILQEAKRRNGSSGSGARTSGSGDINAGAIINNNSTSIAVGNWQQIEMMLGDGAEGLIMTESHQTNQAESNSQSRVGATLNMEEIKPDTLITNEESSR
ncbi:hypothetical protein [Halomonas icarae]|uniref:Uncharacterized protein n=1 Tax=Halomonas icarae TaxID=2691040 RepID=A0A7X5AKK5_9GAMM|nr:hypothetical protein [Halomonas icarae]MDR5901109.1 hypothetical protein [Halomonas icarae]NAW11385.1 hypothetical protein [Halomonas icarae]